MTIRRFSSRRERLDKAFLSTRLEGAVSYDRIAGYFNSSLLDLMSEQLEAVSGPMRLVCNSDLDPLDVQTARAAAQAQRLSWVSAQPERLLVGEQEVEVRGRLARLHQLLVSGRLEVRVLPDEAFGLVHGKAGVIRYPDRPATCFMGSTNESRRAWRDNYELVWEDASPDAVAWVQEEFDALWTHPWSTPLADVVIEDVGRIAARTVLKLPDWQQHPVPEPAAAVIETPVYRRENGLWAHQKAFVELVMAAHHGPTQQARFVLADQVGLGKTIQLAMCAMLVALSGTKPVLILCPKTLLRQWQAEMLSLLGVPSAFWDGQNWVDETGTEHPAGVNSLRRCPRRIGIVSSGLISRGSEAAQALLGQEYDLVILDEAHRARRKNSGQGKENQAPDMNNLMKFMVQVAARSRSVLLATATPVQLGPIEAWDLLNILGQHDDSVLGNAQSLWRRQPVQALSIVMGGALPQDETERWQWFSNPLPPAQEHRDFEMLRRTLRIPPSQSIAPPEALHGTSLSLGDRRRLAHFPEWMRSHHPFIRRIVMRTRTQLETQLDAFGQPLLQPIQVILHGENTVDALLLPGYLHTAYEYAEQFTRRLGARLGGAGFLKTLLLRRVGSTMEAGMLTARRLLGDWGELEAEDDEDDDTETGYVRALTDIERGLLEQFVDALEREQRRDPKLKAVCDYLIDRHWIDEGCIIFSQYRDSVAWLAEQLTTLLPAERIALYSGPSTSGIYLGGTFTVASREDIKREVQAGDVRLLLGTDAASEGLNLQRLARLINLDLPWNPTRLEQRKGRIQRIGQRRDSVHILNLRYRDSVEDRVHERLSERLNNIRTLFGQIPDVLEDLWISEALGDQKRGTQLIDALPTRHAFELRNTAVRTSNWEGCTQVLSSTDVQQTLRQGWKSNS